MPPESQTGTEDQALQTTTNQAVENLDTNPQIVTEPADTGQNQGDTTATADPPAADKGEPKTLLEATRRAVGMGDTPAPDQAKDGNTDTASAEGEKPTAEGSDQGSETDADAKLPFHKHPRWQEVIRERNDARGQVAELTPDAQAFRAVKTFMDNNGLTADEVRNGFAIMGAMRNDPQKAWELLSPLVDNLHTVLGMKLPDDLARKVEAGETDEATAAELARTRNMAALDADRTRRQVTQADMNARAAHATRVAQTVDAWVSTQQASDPDFARVQPLLEGAVLARQRAWAAQGKSFATPDSATALVKEAYESVAKTLGAVRPQRTQIKAPPGSTVSTAAPPKPKTLLDAITQAAGGNYTG